MAGEGGWQKQRIIHLFSDCDQNAAYGIISQMYGLAAESDDPITLWLNTNGGEVRHAIAIIDAMNACPVVVNTVAIGKVYSAGLLIYIVGKLRIAFPNTMFMAHQFRSQQMELSRGDSIGRHEAENKTEQWMLEHFKKYTSVPEAKIKRLFMGHERFFDAQQALEFGVADQIIQGEYPWFRK